jgi:acetyl-CoA carboxylase biotin carboxylase subunit
LIDDPNEALKVAREIGFPVLVKATAGGGGKGMRVAANDLTLKTALEQAAQEAQAAFGNGGVYLEKFVEHPRHVEVQVIADTHGNAVHLWERDCSTQRRHQKLIEESPAPTLPDKVRKSICEAAVRMIKNANYHNAATVEFIVDKDNNFYFIEVNARIQVEHPVTEMVTGIDLIQQQIRVAAGEKLSFHQKDIVCNGVSIECRINAEDPEKNFQPSPGRIDQIYPPGGLGVRFDSHVHAGYVVPPFYDSMIGKLIVFGDTREHCLARLRRSLREMALTGVETTIPLFVDLLDEPDFQRGDYHIHWLEEWLAD